MTHLRKKSLTKTEILIKALNDSKIIQAGFTGKIEINLRDGGISTILKIEHIISG